MAILIYSPTEPEPADVVDLPLDPEDLDSTRPEDVDVCTWCHGQGLLPAINEDHPERVCHQCHGTGLRGAA